MQRLITVLTIISIYSTFHITFSQENPLDMQCIPTIDKLKFDVSIGQYEPRVEKIIQELFDADQSERQFGFGDEEPSIQDINALRANDLIRRLEVLKYLKAQQVSTGESFFYSAFIFQHGECSEHYAFANKLAAIAIELGYYDAKWIFAATLDRFLLSIGEKQKFGTQYISNDGCSYELQPYDPETTDEERHAYDVPSLEEAIAQAELFSICPD